MHSLLTRLSLAACATLVALVLAELAWRQWAEHSRAISEQAFFEHATFGWAAPHYVAFDPEAQPIDESLYRILVVGDSYLDRLGYREQGRDMRFPAIYQRSSEDAVVTQVLSTQGWGTDQELMAYLHKGRRWKPDLVIVAFCANNDLANITSNTQGAGSGKPWFLLEDGELSFHERHGELIQLDSLVREEGNLRIELLEALRRSLGGGAETGGSREARVDPRYKGWNRRSEHPGLPSWDLDGGLDFAPQSHKGPTSAYIAEDFELNAYQWKLMEAILAEFNARVDADGATLAVLLLPGTLHPRDLRFAIGSGFEVELETPEGPFTFRADEPRDRLRDLCARQGIRFLDPSVKWLAEVREKHSAEEIWDHEANRHWNTRGQAILAKILEEMLHEELGLFE